MSQVKVCCFPGFVLDVPGEGLLCLVDVLDVPGVLVYILNVPGEGLLFPLFRARRPR
jgi:hypothetical protein